MEDRIEQFRKMAEADPQNEMGHFSLGKALGDAGRYDEAIAPLQRTLELNPTYSKAYELLGEAQMKAGDTGAALETLTTGFKIADERGDRMPRDKIAKYIVALGGSVPKSVTASSHQKVADGADFNCSRCGKPSARMPERPFKGELGERIWANVCMNCWREWIPTGTKVINELGLQLADSRSRGVYDEHMKEFLQIVG